MKRIKATDQEIIEAATTSKSGAAAALKLGIKYDTFRIHALRLGVFNTNQSGKGISKPINDERKYVLKDILSGKHSQYATGKLKKRLIAEGLKYNTCEECGISDWNGQELVMHLDHKDGNRYNHSLENLRMLCPNCHSQTDTYCGRNKTK